MCFVKRRELRIFRSGGNLPPWETRGAVSPGKRGKWRIRRSGGLKAVLWALRVRGCGRFTRRRFVYAGLYGGVDAAATVRAGFWGSGAVTVRIRYALWRQVAAATDGRDFGVLAWLQCVYAMSCGGRLPPLRMGGIFGRLARFWCVYAVFCGGIAPRWDFTPSC